MSTFFSAVPNIARERGMPDSRLVCHYLETSDFKSTENLRKHARTCWGVETIAAADETGNLCAALEVLKMGQ